MPLPQGLTKNQTRINKELEASVSYLDTVDMQPGPLVASPNCHSSDSNQFRSIRHTQACLAHITPMQVKVSACRVLHVMPPTPVFHFTKLSTVIGPLKKATMLQVSPG